MDEQTLNSTVNYSKKGGLTFLATASKMGVPHIAPSNSPEKISERHITTQMWYCAGTLGNLEVNKHISVITWNPATDEGYQLQGEVTEIISGEIIDGYAPEIESIEQIPQVQWQLTILVKKITSFHQKPHTDTEL